ncbi:MAG: type II toxin-antitoxin system HicA family toxin, partial [bacterium]|nr:type II toxin-antitoxin system HicA family toxin [bacterium]
PDAFDHRGTTPGDQAPPIRRPAALSKLSPPPAGGREGGISTLFPEEPKRVTVVPKKRENLAPGTLKAILQQCGMTTEELRKLL